MDSVRPADYSIWAQNELARTDSVLAYGHRGWPIQQVRLAAGAARPQAVGMEKTSGQTTGQRDGQGKTYCLTHSS